MKRLGRIVCAIVAVMLAISSFHAEAGPNMVRPDFSHVSTGFPLIGGHATAACETCHVGGMFQGTPRNCAGCHALGNRVGATPKPANHIVTDAPCETCHFNTATFLGAHYNHGTAIPGQCATCHNGRIATGRPTSHNAGMKATDSCDRCHRSFAWLPSSWNHTGMAPHSCSNAGCHMAGANPYFKPANHQTSPYLGRNTFYCDDCHTYNSWIPARFAHNRPSPSGVCMGCHDGVNAPGKNPGHISTAEDCVACHASTITFLGARYNHGRATPGQCATCHSVRPASHSAGLKATDSCDLCHRTSAWLPTSWDHSRATPHSCATAGCHVSGANQYFKPANHQTSPHLGRNTFYCDDCHTSTSWTPARFAHNRPSPSGVCVGCHDGTNAPGKNSGHITTTEDCVACHASTTTFLGARYNHSGAIPGQCATCHNGAKAAGRPASHSAGLKATDSCDLCHRTSAWLPTSWDHSRAAPHSCASAGCHVTGANQYFKPANHQTSPYLGRNTFYCDDCHTYNSWVPARFVHNRPSPAGVCMGCHDGTNAPGKNSGHITTTEDCVACHASTTSFLGARYNHSGAIPGQCATCHNGAKAAGRPASHSAGLKATDSCDTCHRTSAWLPTSWDHSRATPHSCATAGCHVTGANQYFKPANHQTSPYLGRNTFYCDDCHTYNSWVPARFAHNRPSPAGVCMGCHDGVNAPGKGAGHVATADDCVSCHTSTATWGGAMEAKPAGHVAYAAGVPCNACHRGSTVATGAALHAFLPATCNSCHFRGMVVYAPNNPITQSSHEGNRNCSASSCHAPLGRKGIAYIDWGG